MSLSLTDAQLTMLRLAKRHLVLPGKSEVLDHRNDLAMLIDLALIEPHDAGFRVTRLGETVLQRADGLKPPSGGAATP